MDLSVCFKTRPLDKRYLKDIECSILIRWKIHFSNSRFDNSVAMFILKRLFFYIVLYIIYIVALLQSWFHINSLYMESCGRYST